MTNPLPDPGEHGLFRLWGTSELQVLVNGPKLVPSVWTHPYPLSWVRGRDKVLWVLLFMVSNWSFVHSEANLLVEWKLLQTVFWKQCEYFWAWLLNSAALNLAESRELDSHRSAGFHCWFWFLCTHWASSLWSPLNIQRVGPAAIEPLCVLRTILSIVYWHIHLNPATSSYCFS